MLTKQNQRAIVSIVVSKVLFFISLMILSGCEVDDPAREDVPELITKVELTFTPAAGGSPVVVTATDPDGDGVQDIQVDENINLQAETTYLMSIGLINGLAQPSDPEYNVTDEVAEEGQEHIFFFSWTNDVFVSPAGDGNIDNRSDAINYEDEDANGLPIGLETSWITASPASGELRIVLKHQPDLKSTTSDANTGETDLDITFDIHIK